MADEMEGAIQQAAHPERHSMSPPHDSSAGIGPLTGDGGLAETAPGLGDAIALPDLAWGRSVDMFPTDALVVPIQRKCSDRATFDADGASPSDVVQAVVA